MSLAQVSHHLIDGVSDQEALDQPIQHVQQALQKLGQLAGSASKPIEDTLHGVPFGHPLHPALVSIPVGAWTVTQILDVMSAYTDEQWAASGADASLMIGLVGALAAAAAGTADWKETDGHAQRTGFIHGMLNIAATGLYARSLVLRRRNERKAARQLSLAGYSLVMLSSFLGGDLVFRQRIGTNHARVADQPTTFVAALEDQELAEGVLRRVEVADIPIVLARYQGHVYALADQCAHLGGSLAEGQLEGKSIRCPLHGSRFALEDGHVCEGPSAFPQPCFAVRVRAGSIEVQAAQPHQLVAKH